MVASLLLLNRITAASDLLNECEELSILVSDKLLTTQILLYQAKVLRAKKNTMKRYVVCLRFNTQPTALKQAGLRP